MNQQQSNAARALWAKMTPEEISREQSRRSRLRKKIPLEDRLLAMREIVGECWLFTGSLCGRGYLEGKGYGVMHDGRPERKRRETVHRIAYELFIGPIPEWADVLHTCDIPRCFNPKHLFLGTHRDNMEDMIAKGRKATEYLIGENNSQAKLTEENVREILRSTGSQQSVADRFNVSQVLIGKIRRRESWKHVTI